MNITCYRCHEDISHQCDAMFEKFKVGRVKCDKCGTPVGRYISEADILLYLSISETLYLILSLGTSLLYYFIGVNWILIPLLIAIIIGAYFLQKNISRYIYDRAPLKEDYCTREFEEDADQIARSMNWQFVLFFALAITAITGTAFQLFFLFVAVFANALNYLKFYLCIRKERSQL